MVIAGLLKRGKSLLNSVAQPARGAVGDDEATVVITVVATAPNRRPGIAGRRVTGQPRRLTFPSVTSAR